MAWKESAVTRGDATIRQMAADGEPLSVIARAVGTNKRHVKAYILAQQIPYTFHGKGMAMERNPRWRGGRIVDQDGYILVKAPDHPNCDRHRYVREHRLVMEQVLGRFLTPDEVVHHIDGDKQNNHPDNLQVYGSNPDHLAETLKGQRPQWTSEGWAKMTAPKGEPQGRLHKSSRARSTGDAEPSPGTTDR